MSGAAPDPKTMTETRTFDEPGLQRFAAELALFARPGMAILLKGDLGTGKSTFARAFIHALAPEKDFDVPSPTFTLVQTYDETRVPVAHGDLYRVTSEAELDELGLADLLSSHLLIVEWPEKIMAWPMEDRLLVELRGNGSRRDLTITASGAWTQALRRNDEINAFLAATAWAGATRRFLEGDASFRRYETVHRGGDHAILMDMPARPDGPPVRNGKPTAPLPIWRRTSAPSSPSTRSFCAAVTARRGARPSIWAQALR